MGRTSKRRKLAKLMKLAKLAKLAHLAEDIQRNEEEQSRLWVRDWIARRQDTIPLVEEIQTEDRDKLLKRPSRNVKLNFEEFTSKNVRTDLPPVVIAHGMLGSLANWTSISKSLHRLTGRRIIAFDARNHGGSEHTDTMSYAEMSTDIVELLQQQLNIKSAVLVGHSMGGRSVMYTALTRPEVVDRIVIVDISPVNQKFDVTDSTELNMSHFFHLLKSVRFQDNQPISKVRKDADAQLAKRLKNAGIRAWLLMNLHEDPTTGKIGWRVNLDAIHNAFEKDIINFPIEKFESKATYDGPSLFIGGADSEYLPVHHHPDILELFPRAEFAYIAGAGHWVHSQKPAEFVELLVKFLKQE